MEANKRVIVGNVTCTTPHGLVAVAAPETEAAPSATFDRGE